MNSDITRIGLGARMSEAVCYNGIVWVAGQVGNPGDSVADQTRTCLAEVGHDVVCVDKDPSKIERLERAGAAVGLRSWLRLQTNNRFNIPDPAVAAG